MNETSLELTREEREFVLRLLRSAIGETRVEARRTHTPAFREDVLAEEGLLRDLIAKFEKRESAASKA